MWPDWIAPALGLVLIVEGLLPLLNPGVWRRLFEQVLQMTDGQIRFFGMASVTAGCLLVVWLAP